MKMKLDAVVPAMRRALGISEERDWQLHPVDAGMEVPGRADQSLAS